MNTLETKPCNIKSANELDKNDPLSHFRERFHFPKFNSNKPYIYFSGNSLGLQPNTAEQYVVEELEAWKQMGVNAHLGAKRPWLAYHEFLTSYSAEIVGAQDKEVVVMNALTVNLHLLMTSFYRPKGVRKKILIEKHAFPSDRYAIQSQLRFHGNDPNDDLIILESNDEKFISMNTIVDYLSNYGEEIALVLIGGVNYYTGQAFDMAAITDKAQNCGCRVGFDLAHAAGNITLHLHNWGVDFAAWCGYKYLNGGPGAPSGVFIHERHLGRSDVPRFEGWWGHDKSTRFDMLEDYKPLETVEAWQLSNPPILSMAALLSSLEIFQEAGMKSLRQKSEKLTSYLELLINSEFEKQIEIITPISIQSRGCQLSLRLLKPVSDITKRLNERGVLCDWRGPDVIRVAPVPLYNSFEDCYNFVEILKEILNEC